MSLIIERFTDREQFEKRNSYASTSGVLAIAWYWDLNVSQILRKYYNENDCPGKCEKKCKMITLNVCDCRVKTIAQRTYMRAMYQLSAENEEAAPNSAKPIRAIVGAITSGPKKRSTKPIAPVAPMPT